MLPTTTRLLLLCMPCAPGGALTGKYITGGPGVEKARLNLFQGAPAGPAAAPAADAALSRCC